MKQILQKGMKTRHKGFLSHINKKKKEKNPTVESLCFNNRVKTGDNLSMAQKLYT